MRCPNCISREPLQTVRPNPVAFPLNLLVNCVTCQSCLRFYYRIRGAAFLIESAKLARQLDRDPDSSSGDQL